MCKQSCWATFRFPPFVSTECSVQESHQKCTKRLDAAKKKRKQCEASKCLYASKVKFTIPAILCRQNARFIELKKANLCNKSLLRARSFLPCERASAPNQAFCVDRMRDSRMLAKVFQAIESSKKRGLG